MNVPIAAASAEQHYEAVMFSKRVDSLIQRTVAGTASVAGGMGGDATAPLVGGSGGVGGKGGKVVELSL